MTVHNFKITANLPPLPPGEGWGEGASGFNALSHACAACDKAYYD